MLDDKSELSFAQKQLRNVEDELLRDNRKLLQEQLLSWGNPADDELRRLVWVLNMIPAAQIPAGWAWVQKVHASAVLITKLWEFQASLGDSKNQPKAEIEEPEDSYKEVNEVRKE
jgi:hypothetical protein